MPKEGYSNNLKVLYSTLGSRSTVSSTASLRSIPQQPVKILDAPEVLDDYYLNLLDWSKDNILSVALGLNVFLWNGSSGEIVQLTNNTEPDDFVTSVSWANEKNVLAVGMNNSEIQLWDVERSKVVRRLRGHPSRVGSLAWNKYLLSSGDRDGKIFHHDVRQAQAHIATLENHSQEICGLKWSVDGQQLASGGNDNLVNIWSLGESTPKFTFSEHTAAVKALAWCPWMGSTNVLATGGGTADRTIRFWNTTSGTLLHSLETNSQVCQLQWSRHHKELISSHGYSQNQICVWKYPTMTKLAELTGHQARVLHMVTSPDGETIATMAGDETLRFWRIAEAPKACSTSAKAAQKSSFLTTARKIR
jgi:cell division cycle protein 20 (cofactor of APC complex)